MRRHMSERTFERVANPQQLCINVSVSIESQSQRALVVDLSTAGMRVSGPEPLTVGAHLLFTLDLSVVPSLRLESLALRGVVRWVAPDQAPGRFLAGIQFDTLPAYEHCAVVAVLDRLAL